MDEKRIVFYIGSLAKGGAERVIVNLASFFKKEGYLVYVVTKLKEEDEYPLQSDIPRIIADITSDEERGRIRNLFLRIHKLRRIFKELHPDAIISFIGKNNLMSIAAARPLHIPVAVSVRSDPNREIGFGFYGYLTKFLFHFASGIILQTRQAAEFFSKSLQKKIVILPNSINPDFLRTPYQRERIKEIVTVGRIDTNKNQQMLITAFATVAEHFPDWNLILYGDGEGAEQCRRQTEKLHLTNRVHFMGVCSDIPSRIEHSAVFVLSSTQEGMPNALIEAMVLGLAVISTDCPCGGPGDLIQNGQNGILIPVKDTEALTQALEQLMAEEELRIHLGTEALKLRDRLSPDQVNAKWKHYVERTLRNI